MVAPRVHRLFRGLAVLCATVTTLGLMTAGCATASHATSATPSSRCADLVAQAVTSYYVVEGAGRCVRLRSGAPVADLDLADFTAYPPPVFDLIDRSCGYHTRDHTFTYLVSNAADRAAGRLIILVDGQGRVRNVAKHIDRPPGGSTPVVCPRPEESYVFRS